MWKRQISRLCQPKYAKCTTKRNKTKKPRARGKHQIRSEHTVTTLPGPLHFLSSTLTPACVLSKWAPSCQRDRRALQVNQCSEGRGTQRSAWALPTGHLNTLHAKRKDLSPFGKSLQFCSTTPMPANPMLPEGGYAGGTGKKSIKFLGRPLAMEPFAELALELKYPPLFLTQNERARVLVPRLSDVPSTAQRRQSSMSTGPTGHAEGLCH